MTLSRKGANFLCKHEGLRLKAYKDTVGVWTIGYGTSAPIFKKFTGKELTADTTISEAEAKKLFYRYFEETGIYEELNQLGFTRKDQSKFDALCSMLYNTGLVNHGFNVLNGLTSLKYIVEAQPEFADVIKGDATRKYKLATKLSDILKFKDWVSGARVMSIWKSPREIIGRRKSEIRLFLSGEYY